MTGTGCVEGQRSGWVGIFLARKMSEWLDEQMHWVDKSGCVGAWVSGWINQLVDGGSMNG